MLDKWPPVRDITLKPIMHEKSKHIEIYWHFISDKIHLDDIVTTFVNSNDQLVDILINHLENIIFTISLDHMIYIYIHTLQLER